MNNYPKSKLIISQSGATLIVVLMFLLLIIVVGVIAVRSSMTTLRLATSDQVDTLLLTTSDSTNKNIENIINDSANNNEKAIILGPLGFFGYFLNTGATSNRGDQIVFCYRPRQDYFFKMSEATITTPSGQSKLVGGVGSGGFCRPNESDDFVNARQNVMTQVSVTRPNTQSLPIAPFENVPLGKSITTEDATSSSPSFRINSASFLPALSNVSDADITKCLKKPSENAATFVSGVDEQDPTQPTYFGETRNECLAKIGVPTKVLITEVKLENEVNSENCIDYGVGTNEISAECQKLLNLSANGTPK